MADLAAKPIIFLAFANDRQHAGAYLRNLGREADRLRTGLQQASALCEVIERHSVTPAQILQVFQQYKGRIAIFHYAGHAEDYIMLLENSQGERTLADARGLAEFLRQQQGLQLVFLNACSTRTQADTLRDAGVPVVIATARAIDDELAAGFADAFYQSLASGDTVESAFANAKGAVQFSQGELTRHLRPVPDPAEEHAAQGLPWELYQRDGATLALDWSLPTAAGDPLWRLPALPELDLPPKPFRDLSWFRHADAPIFFGRGQQIRQLYTVVTDAKTAPIVLFYGQSGVGKSSLLDAGLLPRLAQVQRVVYLRRDHAQGLLGTLLVNLPGGSGTAGQVLDDWRTAEQQANQPLTLILDQVEEHFTRPNKALPDEMAQFLDTLVIIFADRSQRPQGKLILSFRKEWLAEIEKRLSECELPFSKVFLERLDEAGVIEAVCGVAQTPALQQHYGLTVEEGLADEIANDLLKDREAALAPVLQILLTRLWEEATRREQAKPRFDRILYDQLRREGLKLKEFLDRQLAQLREQQQDVVDSGLALDLLTFHTTPLGTAEQRDFTALQQAYQHRAGILSELVRSFQNLYLLVDPAADQADTAQKSRLAHDTLAPLVRARFDESDLPGQRARRILESRASEWDGVDDPSDPTPLDRQDLGVVEAGEAGMRAWKAAELRLIEFSRKERSRRERLQRILWTVGAVAILLIAGSSIFGWWQWGAAKKEATRADGETQNAIQAKSTAVAEATNAFIARETAVAETTRAYDNEVDAQEKAALAATREAEAKENALRFRTRDLLSRADVVLAQDAYDPSLPLLLARQAVATTLQPYGYVDPFVDSNLWRITNEVQSIGWRMNLPRAQHIGEVYSIAFSPAGTLILTAGEDQSARLWDLTTGEQKMLFLGHRDAVFDAIFSPDGQTIATAGDDGTVRLWNPTTGQQVAAWLTHSTRVRSLDFSPDGKTILTASQDGSARLWDVATKQELRTFNHDGGWILAAKFSIDGAKLVTTGEDSNSRLWDARTGELLAKLSHNSWARAVAFSPDGKRFVTVTAKGQVYAWDVNSGEQLGEFDPHAGQVNDAVFSATGEFLVTVANHGEIFRRDGVTGRVLDRLPDHKGEVLAAQFSPDGQRLVTTGADGTVRIWDIGTGKIIRIIGGHTSNLHTIAYSPDDRLLASGGASGLVGLWDAETGVEVGAFVAHTQTIRSLAFNPSGNLMVTASDDATAQLWDVASREPLTTLIGYTGTVMAVAFSPDGEWIVTGGEPQTVMLWEVATGDPIRAFVGHTDTVRSAIFGLDGKTILTGSDDKTARLWDAETGEELTRFTRHTGSVRAVAFSPDGKKLVTAGSDNRVIVWDSFTKQIIITILGHTNGLRSVIFGAKGNTLLTAGSDQTARLWDVNTGRQLQHFVGHNTTVNSAIFMPDGQQIASAGEDGTVRLWNIGSAVEQSKFGNDNSSYVRFATFSKDDKLLLSGGEDRSARLWQANTATELIRFRHAEAAIWSAQFSPDEDMILTAGQDGTLRLWDRTIEIPSDNAAVSEITQEVISATLESPVNFAGFSPDGKYIVTASDDARVRLWTWSPLSLVPIRQFIGHKDKILQAAFSPDGRLLATASADRTARLWDVETGMERAQFLEHHDWVWFVAFDPTGERLVTTGGDGTARVWDVVTGEQLLVLRGHTTGLVRTAQFSPDGKFIVTAGEDKTARIWDAATGAEVRQLAGHTQEVWYAGFSHTGDTIVTTSFDGTVRLWPATITSALAKALLLIQRDPPIFTQLERDEYEISE